MVKPLPAVLTIGAALDHLVILVLLAIAGTVAPNTPTIPPLETEVGPTPDPVLALLLQLHATRVETGAGILLGPLARPPHLLTLDRGAG